MLSKKKTNEEPTENESTKLSEQKKLLEKATAVA